MLENYTELWDEIKEQIGDNWPKKTGDKATKYSKHFIKIRFKTNDDLPLNKINIPVCVVIVSSQIHRTDKYSQHSSIIWPVWLNG